METNTGQKKYHLLIGLVAVGLMPLFVFVFGAIMSALLDVIGLGRLGVVFDYLFYISVVFAFVGAISLIFEAIKNRYGEDVSTLVAWAAIALWIVFSLVVGVQSCGSRSEYDFLDIQEQCQPVGALCL